MSGKKSRGSCYMGLGGLKGVWGMHGLRICVALTACFVLTIAGAASAQQNHDVSPEDQLAPSQMTQPMPGRAAEPASAPKHSAQAAKPPAAAGASEKPGAGATMKTVACSGPFSKDSSNLRLAITFDAKNITYSDINVSGSPVGSSVIYPKDPKRRLEIWWQNQANRNGIYLILINGQSTWVAPGGMKLGLTLADLEKLNHKPFKLKGFDKDHNATVSDWDGGALATLQGGCKSGVSSAARFEGEPRFGQRIIRGQRIQLRRPADAGSKAKGQRNSDRLLGVSSCVAEHAPAALAGYSAPARRLQCAGF